MLNNRLMELIDKMDTLKGQNRIDCLTEIDMLNALIEKDIQETMSYNDKIANRYNALVKHYTNK